MTHQWDEFSKSLSEAVPRRQSLRLLGAAIAGALFSPLGTAWAAGQDPCKAFCNRCSNKTQQNQCLAACKACNGNTSRLGGYCGGFVCCQTAACSGVCSDLRSDPNCGACGNNCRAYGESCCGNYCADLANDVENCGKCGTRCNLTGPYEYGACVQGACVYDCVDGAVDCGDGMCTYLGSDPNNCGACGYICPTSAPVCEAGACVGGCVGSCPEGWCGGDGCGGECACPSGFVCDYNGYCYDANDCPPGTDFLFDANNCGACRHACQSQEFCSWGNCESGGGDYGYGY
jgi:hypothetical protein